MYQYNLYPTLKQKLKNSSIRTLFQKDLKSAPHSRTTLPSPFGGERQSLCAYLGQRQRDLQDAVDGDLAKDIDQVLSCTPEELPDRLDTLAYKPDMLLINIDVFEDIFDAVDILTCLRERHPEIIVLMGNISCQAGLGRQGITRLRGQWTESYGRPTLPMVHPAYLLRNPQAKREAWADLLELQARLRTGP